MHHRLSAGLSSPCDRNFSQVVSAFLFRWRIGATKNFVLQSILWSMQHVLIYTPTDVVQGTCCVSSRASLSTSIECGYHSSTRDCFFCCFLLRNYVLYSIIGIYRLKKYDCVVTGHESKDVLLYPVSLHAQ